MQRADGGTYDLFQLPRETPREVPDNPDSKRGLGMAACFVARNRFAVLDKNGMVGATLGARTGAGGASG